MEQSSLRFGGAPSVSSMKAALETRARTAISSFAVSHPGSVIADAPSFLAATTTMGERVGHPTRELAELGWRQKQPRPDAREN
jgi:hypothetical protein